MLGSRLTCLFSVFLFSQFSQGESRRQIPRAVFFVLICSEGLSIGSGAGLASAILASAEAVSVTGNLGRLMASAHMVLSCGAFHP